MIVLIHPVRGYNQPWKSPFWKQYTSVGGEATTSQSVVVSQWNFDKANQALQVAIITERSHGFLEDWREKLNDHLMLQIIFFRRYTHSLSHTHQGSHYTGGLHISFGLIDFWMLSWAR